MKMLILAAIAASQFIIPSEAVAGGCHTVTTTVLAQGEAQVITTRVCDGTEGDSRIRDTSIQTSIGGAACPAYEMDLQVDLEDYCFLDTQPEEVTPALVSRAMRNLPLPPAHLQVQPPNGRTLVNFATNFYTERTEFTRTVRLLGQRVQLRITPSRFTWHFDDGESATTTTPGAPHPRLEVTHDYLSKGGVSPRVDTTYTAVFRVGGGAWRPVPGSVTIPGATVELEVVEASPVLVGYN